MSTPKKRVLVVDDHPLMRDGIVQLLNRQPDLMACGEAGNQEEVIEALKESAPDIVLLDLRLGHGDGIELIKQLRLLYPHIPILVHSMYDEQVYAERIIRAGADGYVMKDNAPDAVVAGLHEVLRGGIALSGEMKNDFVRRLLGRPRAREESPVKIKLTDRELQVFNLIGAGLKTKQIATEMTLSGKTIETYRENIKNKLGLRDADDLFSAAKQWVDSA
jgi:DNA-binding NarL/FixJ family response regulator